MGNSVYCFDDFRLDPLARELTRHGEPVGLAASAFDCLVYLIEHRERPVGKDELIAAVWGRADVSDNLLPQTMLRLRRLFGDAGNEQRCIKTIPRVGYRWMLDTAVISQSTHVTASSVPTAGEARAPSLAPSSPRRLRPALLLALLITLALAASYWGWQYRRGASVPPAVRFEHTSAVVLPATVDGPDDWKWLRLGLMDLIANQLRAAKVPTESSQSVLKLLSEAGQAKGAGLASFALVISPHVGADEHGWHVQLDAKSQDGRAWQARSSSANVLEAARAASDLLLAQLGHGTDARQQAGSAQQEYVLRIEAAQLAGHPDLAKALIDQAPAALRGTPDFAYAEADFHCNAGEVERCERGFNQLLKQLPAEQRVLRGKVLTSLWYSYYRKHRYAEGETSLNEAVSLLQGQKDAEALATAYLDRAHLKFLRAELDEAAADLGLARVNYALAGDTVGQSKVDVSMAGIAMQRGQFVQAQLLLEHAYAHYQRMGMRELISTPLQGLVYSHKMLLQFAEELTVTDGYWPLEQKNLQFCDDYVRRALVILRAVALADNGRTAEATAVLQLSLLSSPSEDEPAQRAWTYALLAKWALERGDMPAAQASIAKAMQGSALAQDADRRNYAEASLINIDVLLRAGRNADLQRSVSALQAWMGTLPAADDWLELYLMRAKAAAAWSGGRQAQALAQLKLAMALADKLGVPELIVSVGQPYALALLHEGKLDQALAVSGRLSGWSQTDWRAAWIEACLYRALGQTSAWDAYRSKAQVLAGDRVQLTEPGALAF